MEQEKHYRHELKYVIPYSECHICVSWIIRLLNIKVAN